MKRITLHPEAEGELRASERFYENRGGPELALDFVKWVREGLHLLGTDPQRFPFLAACPKARKCRLARFPFSIYYVERSEDIWVLAVAHAKRRPGYWVERLA